LLLQQCAAGAYSNVPQHQSSNVLQDLTAMPACRQAGAEESNIISYAIKDIIFFNSLGVNSLTIMKKLV